MAPHSSVLAWRIPGTGKPVFSPGESQGRGSLVDAVYGVAQSWTRLKRLSSSSSTQLIYHQTQSCIMFWSGRRLVLFNKNLVTEIQFSSVQFSRSVTSDSLRPHELQHARPPCPSPTPGRHSDSRPSSQRCHPAISSSVVPFSSCPQSLPASESFPMSQLFA